MELKNIFELIDNNNIVVPEIQREYVWGEKDNVFIALNVIDDLKKSCAENANKNMGFLYSYAANDKDIYLIDGQQRFTTMVLLAFYLSIKENKVETFRENFRVDSTRMAFSYRVRSETETFLTEMFSKCSSLVDIKELKDMTWFHSYYANDVSISNMANTLIQLYDYLKSDTSLTYSYIMSKVEFWYFNVEETSQGEELYITMNSRGESLTQNEYFKPLLLEKLKKDKHKPKISVNNNIPDNWGKAWDEWEEFIYSNKETNAPIEVVDYAMERLIRIIVELTTHKETQKLDPNKHIEYLDLPQMEQYFAALDKITNLYQDIREEFYISKPDYRSYRVLKALIVGWMKGYRKRELDQIYHLIKNGCRREIIKNGALLRFLAEFSKSSLKLYDFILEYFITPDKYNASNDDLNNLFSPHELLKVRMIRDTESDELEELIWNAQSHSVLKGCLRCLWYEYFDKEDDEYLSPQTITKEQITLLKERYKSFSVLFCDDNIRNELSITPKQGVVDNSLISRALLAENENYKGVELREKQYAFGYKDYWSKIMLIKNYHQTLDTILDKIIDHQKETSLYNILDNLIKEKLAYFREDKDSRYYMLLYRNAFQAMDAGYSVIGFHGNWKNYLIDVLNKASYHGYVINMFKHLVYTQLMKDVKKCPWANDFSEWLVECHTKFFLDCKESHGWMIRWEEENRSDVKDLISYFKKYHPNLIENEKGISLDDIPIDGDLIQEGCKICEMIHSFSKVNT